MINQLKSDVIHTLKSGMDVRIKRCLWETVDNKTDIIAIAINNSSRPAMDCLDALESTQIGLAAMLADTHNFC